MSELKVPDRGTFIRTHRDKVIHLKSETVDTVQRFSGTPKWMQRPLEYLLLFILLAGVVLPCIAILGIICYSYLPQFLGFVGIGGMLLLVLNRTAADTYYDAKPRRSILRLVRK